MYIWVRLQASTVSRSEYCKLYPHGTSTYGLVKKFVQVRGIFDRVYNLAMVQLVVALHTVAGFVHTVHVTEQNRMVAVRHLKKALYFR